MKRTAWMMAVAMLVTAGVTRAAQESVAAGPASPVQGGQVTKKTMTAVGAVKTVTADSLAIEAGQGKDWTFVIDSTTKIVRARSGQETIDVPATSAPQGGQVIP